MTIYSKLIELADSFFQMDRTLEKFGDVYVYFRIFGDVRAFVNNVLAPFVPNGVQQVRTVEMAQKHVINMMSSAFTCLWFPGVAFFCFISGNLAPISL